MKMKLFLLFFILSTNKILFCLQTNQQSNEIVNKSNNQPGNLCANIINKEPQKNIKYYLQKVSTYTQDLIKSTHSKWTQLFLVFILGILMSFTPCIYPIIPVTVGILQAQATKSFFYNFLLSVAYSFGIATTFAIFGFTAALTGHLFGQILMHPIFILFIVSIFIYLGLSMFGFYEMYIPQFLANSNTDKIKHNGSPLSAFIFGAVSGSIASPCLSPGLALLLSIVASMANKLLGFILLFVFGIGLSVPLILIGTFSSSLNILPKSGMWMVEVKKIFGFLLFAMSFYYLSNILPYSILLFLIGIFLIISGIYYFKSIEKYDSKYLKYLKNLIGTILIASSIFVFSKAFQSILFKETEKDIWLKNYELALEQACKTNKKILIDIGAAFCTLCKAIDKHVFNDPIIKEYLKNFVLLKVDATSSESHPYALLKERYKIIGVPTILIIDPTNNNLIKRWEGELYDLPKENVIQELENAK